MNHINHTNDKTSRICESITSSAPKGSKQVSGGSSCDAPLSWVVLTRALTRNPNTNAVSTNEDPVSASVSEASVSGLSATNER